MPNTSWAFPCRRCWPWGASSRRTPTSRSTWPTATRGAGAVNAVSQLHGHTSRYIFRELYPRWPLAAVPVGHVTNGIHLPTWVSPNAEAHWYELHGDEIPWRGIDHASVDELLAKVDDRWLWQIRQHARNELLGFVRSHLARSPPCMAPHRQKSR